MQSAFGIEHPDLVSKGSLGLIPMKTAATKGWERGRKKGLGVASSALRAAGGAIKSSPGTVAAGGTALAGTGATAAYLRN
jgi:hypothetical protein